MNAADPLNLTGILDSLPRVPSLATNVVAYRDGAAVAALMGGELVWLQAVAAEHKQPIAAALAECANVTVDARRRGRRSSRPPRRTNSPARIPRPMIR